MDVRRRVIVGVLGSAHSEQALRQAAIEARTRDAVLAAVYAWVPPGGDLADRRFPEPGVREIWRDAARRRLWAAFGGMPPGVEVEPIVACGKARFVLGEVAARDNDLLVIGTGQRGVFRQLSYARVARSRAGHVTFSVLLVPPTTLAQQMRRPLRSRLSIHLGDCSGG